MINLDRTSLEQGTITNALRSIMMLSSISDDECMKIGSILSVIDRYKNTQHSTMCVMAIRAGGVVDPSQYWGIYVIDETQNDAFMDRMFAYFSLTTTNIDELTAIAIVNDDAIQADIDNLSGIVNITRS